MRDALRLVLERAGYRVVTTTDGNAALAEFERQPNRFALVLTDAVMPGMTGLELIAAVRARRPDQPIVGMSGSIDLRRGAVLHALRPAVEFVEKPIARDALLAAIGRALSARP
jgi:DNA-binding NtrC family response regulator